MQQKQLATTVTDEKKPKVKVHTQKEDRNKTIEKTTTFNCHPFFELFSFILQGCKKKTTVSLGFLPLASIGQQGRKGVLCCMDLRHLLPRDLPAVPAAEGVAPGDPGSHRKPGRCKDAWKPLKA